MSNIELVVDDECTNQSESDDITQNALLHCDCRYLGVDEETQTENPIINVWFANQTNLNETCTTNINQGRKPMEDSPLYLCWENEKGIFIFTKLLIIYLQDLLLGMSHFFYKLFYFSVLF